MTTYPQGSYCDLIDRRYVEDPDSIGEMWRDVKRLRRDNRDATLPEREQKILDLRNSGLKVEVLTQYQFRIENLVDLYPARQRYIVIAGPKKGKRGGYENPGKLLCDLTDRP